MGNLTYPMSTEEPRYAGRGLADNRHRRGPVEAITMNVGDPLGRCQGERKYGGGNTPRKPPMRQKGVSVAIVVGGRESRPHGEGPQLARWVRRNPPECEDGAYRSMSGEHSGPQIPLRRRPYAVKAARTVTTGGMEKRAIRNRALSLPTPWGRPCPRLPPAGFDTSTTLRESGGIWVENWHVLGRDNLYSRAVTCKVLGKLGGDEETNSNGDESI
jgi:hypothetical protein